MVPFYFALTLLLCTLTVQPQYLDQNTRILSVTREENNIDDSITEIFNLCKCVVFYMCDEENYVIPQQQLKTARVPFGRPMRNIFRIRCSNDYYYCCKNRTETPMDSSSIGLLRNVPLSTSSALQCGQSKSNVSNRLIDEFPWVVAIYDQMENQEHGLRCGGSLIHPRVVLTVQECVYSSAEQNLRIVSGREVLGPNVKHSTVSKIIKHELYNAGGPYNIALLILETPLTSTPTVCLPTPNQSVGRCRSVGWSATSQSGSPKLRKSALSISDAKWCKKDEGSRERNRQLHPSYLCIGREEGTEACGKDEGGPLMCLEDGGQYVQMGIVPGSSKCAQNLYTNIGYLAKWISQKIVKESL